MSGGFKKTIQVVAGPNGSGKTTFAESYFLKKLKVANFINPDIIAAGLSPLDMEKVAFQAGRIMLAAVKESIHRGDGFAFESTLSGKTWFPILKDAREKGYHITIYFIYLSRIQENIRRIKKRVELGGHSIPSDTVRRRYPKAFWNFWSEYRALCDDWFIFDNSARKPKLVQSMTRFNELSIDGQMEFEGLFLKRSKG